MITSPDMLQQVPFTALKECIPGDAEVFLGDHLEHTTACTDNLT